MATTKDFFKNKKAWSKYKDELLCAYFLPYLNKIMSTQIPVVYIDGFAGKGKFDDGTAGSPLLIKEKIYQAKAISRYNTQIDAFFVEFQYAEQLKKNLADATLHVVPGDYRTQVPEILKKNYGKNIFLYVDPFGIKYLDFSIFSSLDCHKFNSVELLLNFNSFGFLREGCRLLKMQMDQIEEEHPDFSAEINDTKNDISNMNRIANGDYWQNILFEYRDGKISIFEAEKLFLKQYMCELRKSFSHVCRVPIRSTKSQLAKYQMIFATNNKHGILLMADNMIDCNRRMESDMNYGQLCLFDYEYSLMVCKDFILNELPNKLTELKDFYVYLYEKNGFIYPTKDMNGALKALESEGKVLIERYPTTTKTGKPSKSMDFYKNTIKIKRN